MIQAFGILAEQFARLQGMAGKSPFRLGAVRTNARECSLSLMAGEEKLEELRLPLPMTFSNAMTGLDHWYRVLAQHYEKRTGRKAVQTDSQGGQKVQPEPGDNPIGILQYLQSIQREWNRSGPDASLLRAASRGYAVLLTLLHPDKIDAAEDLFPFALMLTAACRPAGGGISQEIDRGLLARAMGYGPDNAGITVGSDAGPQDRLLAAFLRRDAETIESMAKDGSRLTDYLLMRTYRDRMQNRLADDIARRLLKKSPLHFSAMADLVFAGGLSAAKRTSITLPVFLFMKLEAGPLPGGGIFGDWTHSLEWFSADDTDADLSIARFESMLRQKAAEASPSDFGWVLDMPQAIAVWRCLYLNAMYLRFRLLSERWEKPMLGEAFARRLARRDPQHPMVLAMLGRSAQKLGRPQEALPYLAEIGVHSEANGFMAAWVYDGVEAEPFRLQFWQQVFDRLDGRPAHLAFIGGFLYRLMSLDLADTYTTAALKLNPRFFEGYVLQAAITGRDAGLKDALETFPESLSLLFAAADYYAASGRTGDRETALGLYQALHRLQPANFHVVKQIYGLLRQLNRTAEALLFVESQLKSGPRSRDSASDLHLMLAETHLALGGPREALDSIDQEMASFSPPVLLIAARANEDLGNLDKAMDFIRRAAARGRKDPEVLLPVAAFFWRHGNDRQAAAYVSELREEGIRPLRYEAQFAGSFSSARLKQMREAVGELIASGAGFEEIHRIVVYFAERGKDAIALELLSLCPTGSPAEEMEAVVSRSQLIAMAKGKLNAIQFLADTVSPKKGNLLARSLYQRGMFDAILAEFIQPEAHPTGLQERVWLYRLTAWLATGKESRSMGTLLEEHYRNPYEPAGEPDQPLQVTETIYHTVGRYLMGHLSAETLLSTSPEIDHRAIFAYFVGLSHRFAGENGKATKWYQICLQTGAGGLMEYRWASRELAEWQAAGTQNRGRLWDRPFGQEVSAAPFSAGTSALL